jgi:hypothetical protein
VISVLPGATKVPQVPGSKMLATKSPTTILSVVLVKSSTNNRLPAVPGRLVVMKLWSTATRIKGVAKARSAFNTSSAGIASN